LTVCVASAGPPNAYAALILAVPWPGTSTTVSRGIESDALAPPPIRSSMIESERLGPPEPGSARPFVRASEPSTRIVFAPVSGYGPGSSCALTSSARSPRWICAEIMNSTAESAIQPTRAITSHLTTRPGVRRPRPGRRKPGSFGNRRPRRWTSYAGGASGGFSSARPFCSGSRRSSRGRLR
jgi:hypothetical protein